MPISAQHIKAARLHLQKSDPTMKRILRAVGPCKIKTRSDRFMTLVSSILSQQISTAAASTIRGRLVKAVKPDKVSPESILGFDTNTLRAVGLSRQKASYLLDLAGKVDSGEVDLRSLGRLSDDKVITELTKIKGIGIWTSQMFLMFCLGRLDIFPTDDVGIQNAIKNQYKPRGTFDKKRMEKIATPWRPYATIACWYLWQSLELE